MKMMHCINGRHVASTGLTITTRLYGQAVKKYAAAWYLVHASCPCLLCAVQPLQIDYSQKATFGGIAKLMLTDVIHPQSMCKVSERRPHAFCFLQAAVVDRHGNPDLRSISSWLWNSEVSELL